MRDLRALPKAHLHLHFTGSMRPATMRELARLHGIALPPSLTDDAVGGWKDSEIREWSYFQRRYDAARAVVRTRYDVRRLVIEAAEDDASNGSGWLEIQFDPTSYAPRLGGVEAGLEIVLGAARDAERATGIGVAIVVAGSWARPPEDAEALARLAARYAGSGVVGFGLSNDERCGRVADFAQAFRTTREAGLLGVPHGGFFVGARHVQECVELLGARRVGHGITAVQDLQVLKLLVSRDIALEICPTSYPPFGVVEALEKVPLRQLYDTGVPVALAADDPLLFRTHLADQYTLVREVLGFSDAELAQLARYSIRASAAPGNVKARLLGGVDAWLN
ncbi:MAG: adenosine deaminase [Actinomycetota bacterium]